MLSRTPASSDILRQLDCRTRLALVSERVRRATGASAEAFREQWQALYAALRGIGSLTLTEAFEGGEGGSG